MDQAQCLAFLQALNVQHIRVKENGWVVGSCPLAPWRHQHHTDTTPSFGLSISPGARSHYLCFACQGGSAEELVQALQLYAQGHTGYDFAACYQILSDESYVVPLPPYGEHKTGPPPFEEWPQYWIESFMPAELVQDAAVYLAWRNVPVSTVQQHGLRYDSKRQMVVCPYSDVFGRLAGARGRSVLPHIEGLKKHHDYTYQGRNNARLVWYNEGVLNLQGPVVVVEGQFDCWRVEHAYPKVIAALTAKPSWEKFVKLASAPKVIQIPDNDDAGAMSTQVYAKFCQRLGVPYRMIPLDAGVKDPADCSVEYLRDKIQEVL